MEHVEYEYTRGMDEETVAARLDRADVGVLGLADGDEAYAIPIGHDYAPGRLRFRLADGPDREKLAFIEATDEACFVVHDYATPEDSWSVIARGPIRLLDAEAAPADPAEINAAYPPLRVFGEAVEAIEYVFAELTIESLTGRETL